MLATTLQTLRCVDVRDRKTVGNCTRQGPGVRPAPKRNRCSLAREASEISFHSLGHSAVTLLKASGLSDVFAREIVGHESAAVSRQYTHLSTDDLRAAMRRLPDVTNG